MGSNILKVEHQSGIDVIIGCCPIYSSKYGSYIFVRTSDKSGIRFLPIKRNIAFLDVIDEESIDIDEEELHDRLIREVENQNQQHLGLKQKEEIEARQKKEIEKIYSKFTSENGASKVWIEWLILSFFPGELRDD